MRCFRVLIISLSVFLAFMLFPTPTFPQYSGHRNHGTGTAEDPYIVPKSESEIRVDAVLEEEAWKKALVLELKYPREHAYHIGLFPRDRSNNCYMCQALKIKGFEGASPGRNVEINPTIIGARTDERSAYLIRVRPLYPDLGLVGRLRRCRPRIPRSQYSEIKLTMRTHAWGKGSGLILI